MKRQEFLNKIALMSDQEFNTMIQTFKEGGEVEPAEPDIYLKEPKFDRFEDFINYLKSVNKYEPKRYDYTKFYYDTTPTENGIPAFQKWVITEWASKGKANIPAEYDYNYSIDSSVIADIKKKIVSPSPVDQVINTQPVQQVKLKKGGSIIDQLKQQLGDSQIADLLQHFGLDELMEGGLKNTSNMSISITITGSTDSEEPEDDGGHVVPELGLITVGDKEYKIETVTTEADWKQGLGGRESLDEDKGMLFDFNDTLEDVEFNVADMKFPIDIIFINDDDEVVKVASDCKPGKDLFTCSNVRYVLEVNANSGIKEGDEVVIEDCPDDKTPIMKVLAPNGDTQMELQGGERIMSRHDTKLLIKWAKKSEESKSDSDYKHLGNLVFKFIRKQDNNEPEYVQLPEDDQKEK